MHFSRKVVFVIIAAGSALVLGGAGCMPTRYHEPREYDEGDPGHRSAKIALAGLFPFESSSNYWEYSDGGGNLFLIQVVDTISDEEDVFYKVAFTETKLNQSQQDWFVKENGEIRYSQSLRGEFGAFLPADFDLNGGSFSSGASTIQYEFLDTCTLGGGRTYSGVVQLEYAAAILHGFDTVYFARDIGIVALVDRDGRWPIEYTLRRAVVGGRVIE